MKILLNRNVLFGIAALLLFVAIPVLAASPFDIQYPVSELGNCADQKACKTYCDDVTHEEACRAFAEAHGFVGKKKQEERQKFEEAIQGGGPGGCTTITECKAFCDIAENMQTCIDFAESKGLMTGKQLSEAKQVREAILRGAKLPGNCKTKEECQKYCTGDSLKKDAKRARECLAFAKEAGFLDETQVKQTETMITLLEKGEKTPGNCKLEECRTYCSNPDHLEECVAFAEKAGLMNSDEAARARKIGARPGPGDCRGEACKVYCEDPAHEEECKKFALENDLVPPEQKQRIEENAQKFREILSKLPPEAKTCLEGALGTDELQALTNGAKLPTKDVGERVAGCFRRANGQHPASGETKPQPSAAVLKCLSEKGIKPEDLQKGPVAGAEECLKLVRPASGLPGENGKPVPARPLEPANQSPTRTIPPQVLTCLSEQGITLGSELTVEQQVIAKSCYEAFMNSQTKDGTGQGVQGVRPDQKLPRPLTPEEQRKFEELKRQGKFPEGVRPDLRPRGEFPEKQPTGTDGGIAPQSEQTAPQGSISIMQFLGSVIAVFFGVSVR